MGILQQALGNATDFISNLFGSASKETSTEGGNTVPDRAVFEANNPPAPPSPSPAPLPVTQVQPQAPQIPGISPQQGNLADFGGKIQIADGTISGEQGQNRKDQFNQLKLAMSQGGNTAVSNADFYPDSGSVEMGNAGSGGYNAPVYAGGSAVLFPIAGYDKMVQRGEQERRMSNVIQDQNRAKMVFDLPQINQKVLAEKFMPQYYQELYGLQAKLKETYGADMYKKGATDPDVLAFTSKWKSLPQGLNDVVGRIESYEKRRAERKPGDYFDPMLDELSKQILGGADEFFKGGNINVSDLYEAGNKFRAYENVHNNIIDALKVIKPSESIPLLDAEVQKQLSVNPALNAEYMKEVGLPNNPADYKKWVIAKSINKISDEQADAFATSFMSSNPGSAEAQLALPGDDPAKAGELVYNRLKDMYRGMAGERMTAEFDEWQAKGDNITNVNFGSGGGKKGQGFHESTVLGNDKIISSINEGVKNPNATADQILDSSFGGSWRTIPNDPYARVHVPGAVYNKETTPLRYSDYVQMTAPPLSSGVGSQSAQYAPIIKSELDAFGVKDRNQTPKKAMITDVQFGYAVRDPKTQQWNLITKDNLKKNGLPPGAKQVVVEENILYDSDTPTDKETGLSDDKMNKGLKAYRVYEATLENTRFIDNMTNPSTSNEGAINPGNGGSYTVTTPQSVSLK